ncbi:virion structural protein [Vibrio phage D81]
MAVIQSDFPTYAGKYLLGQLIDNGMADVITRIAEEDIAFGQPVVVGSTDKKCKTAVDANDKFLGIAVRSGNRNIDNENAGYLAGEVISIVRVGRVAVKVAKAAIDGAEVGYKITAASGGNPKTVEFQGTTANGDLLISGAYHAEAGALGSLVAIQLNGNNTITAKS